MRACKQASRCLLIKLELMHCPHDGHFGRLLDSCVQLVAMDGCGPGVLREFSWSLVEARLAVFGCRDEGNVCWKPNVVASATTDDPKSSQKR
jgi:hypothetical protein